MKVTVIGAGTVGSGLIKSFNRRVECSVIDPAAEESVTIDYVLENDVDIVFICLPCLTSCDGTIDVLDLERYLQHLNNEKYQGAVVIKSTLVPYYLEKFLERYANLNIVYSPEFIRASHVEYDSLNPAMVLIASNCETTARVIEWFYELYTQIHRPNIVRCDIATASLVKYFVNSWLATKVVFMNEFKELFDNVETSETWEEFTGILKNDKRIGKSHLDVPGPDGEPGFGGFCFPKDTEALLTYARLNKIELDVLKSAVEKNQDLRDSM